MTRSPGTILFYLMYYDNSKTLDFRNIRLLYNNENDYEFGTTERRVRVWTLSKVLRDFIVGLYSIQDKFFFL